MNREKERLEQLEVNASTRRRRKRGLLRAYMQACINYLTSANGSVEQGLARLELVSHGHELSLMGFRRYSTLRKHARKVLHKKVTVKKVF